MVELDGARVLVTGAANGIGAAIVRAVVEAGAARVLLADLDLDGAQQVADEVRARGAQAVVRQVDVGEEAAVTAMVAAAEQQLEGLDVVVSNAGVATDAGLEATADAWDRCWRINVLAHVHAARAALPGMLERGGGVLIHSCSAAGLLTMVGDAAYTVTKHAAVAFAEWLAVTYGDRGIQVHALCPQGVDTDLLRADGATAERVVRASGAVLEPAAVADEVVAAVGAGRFLVLPHPEVADHLVGKCTDPDRWLAGMRAFAARVNAS